MRPAAIRLDNGAGSIWTGGGDNVPTVISCGRRNLLHPSVRPYELQIDGVAFASKFCCPDFSGEKNRSVLNIGLNIVRRDMPEHQTRSKRTK